MTEIWHWRKFGLSRSLLPQFACFKMTRLQLKSFHYLGIYMYFLPSATLEINANSVGLQKNEGLKGNCREGGLTRMGRRQEVVFQDVRKLEGMGL